MRKIIFILALFLSSESFTQNQVEFYGGTYDSIVYFNWVIQNKERCAFIIEMSEDSGKTFFQVGKDTMNQSVSIPCTHGIKVPTCATNPLLRLTVITEDRVSVYQPQYFLAGTYFRPTRVYTSRVIHANF